MTYDHWKTRSPDDDWDDECGCDGEDEPCDHEDYDIDILTGDWMCWICGEKRAATQAEIDMMIRHQAEYCEYEARENRRQWWRDLFYPVLYPLSVVQWQWQKLKLRWRGSPALDDDIPF